MIGDQTAGVLIVCKSMPKEQEHKLMFKSVIAAGQLVFALRNSSFVLLCSRAFACFVFQYPQVWQFSLRFVEGEEKKK